MIRGTVKFRARIVDTERGLTIPEKCEFNPNETGVEKVEIECPNGTEIVITVHFTAVDTKEMGIATATEIQKRILDRISIHRGIAIENGHPESNLSLVTTQNTVITPETEDLLLISDRPKVSLSLSCDELRPLLEQELPHEIVFLVSFARRGCRQVSSNSSCTCTASSWWSSKTNKLRWISSFSLKIPASL